MHSHYTHDSNSKLARNHAIQMSTICQSLGLVLTKKLTSHHKAKEKRMTLYCIALTPSFRVSVTAFEARYLLALHKNKKKKNKKTCGVCLVPHAFCFSVVYFFRELFPRGCVCCAFLKCLFEWYWLVGVERRILFSEFLFSFLM